MSLQYNYCINKSIKEPIKESIKEPRGLSINSTKIDKEVVYCLLFDSRTPLSEIDSCPYEAVKKTVKNDIFNLLFSQKNVF